MKAFLDQVAEDICLLHPKANFRSVRVILPSKRAALYFKKSLSKCYPKAILSPEIHSIDDFIISSSGLEVLKNLELYFNLYEIYKEIDTEAELKGLEHFLSWIPTLISDFENIDFAMLDQPDKIFKYMSEQLSIEHWGNKKVSETSKNYFDFFVKTGQLYFRTQTIFKNQNIAYRAMAYKYVAENINTLKLIEKFTYFIGFNALNNTEELIFKAFKEENQGKFYWDTDTYFMDNNHKAGSKLRRYHRFSEPFTFKESILETSEKNIEIIACNSEVEQVKLAKLSMNQFKDKSHAVVILDENLFKSILINIPSEDIPFNISIGIPLRNSEFINLLSIIFDNNSKHNYKLNKVLWDELVLNSVFKEWVIFEIGNESYLDLINQINSKNSFIVNIDFKKYKSKALKIISSSDNYNIISDLLENMESFLNIAKKLPPLEKAGIQFFNENLNFFKKLNKTYSPKAISLIWRELSKNQRLPFENNSSSQLQILSMLETRCLDFENITFLSLNEGILPSKAVQNSFFTFDAKKIFNLPIYQDQDAIMSYHFWRLIKRAKNIKMIYVNGSNSWKGQMEKSSFILELEQILSPRNQNIKISYPNYQSFNHLNNGIKKEISIFKSPEIINKFKIFLKNKGLSFSTFSTLEDCHLKFFWSKIEKIDELNENKEEIQENEIGSVIHKIIENVETHFRISKKTISKEDFNGILENLAENLNVLLKTWYPNKDFDYGPNKIHKELITKILNDYFLKRMHEDKEIILANEIKAEVVIPDFFIDIKLIGTIDKISKKGNKTVITDFKTGKKDEKKHTMQLAFYEYFISNSEFIKKEIGNFSPENLSFEIEYLYDLENNLVKTASELPIILAEVEKSIKELLDENMYLGKPNNKDVCKFCQFNLICNNN